MVVAQQGDQNGAIELFRRVEEVSPTYTAARFELGMALFRQGQFKAAIEQFAGVEGVSSRYAPAPYMLGECYRKLGAFGVITSYSIHYTKLYDMVMVRITPSRPGTML